MLFPLPMKQTAAEGNLSGLPSPALPLLDFVKTARKLPFVTVGNDPAMIRDEYRLTVTGTGVNVTASGEEGVFRALTSLRGMTGADGKAPCTEIRDKPQFPQRGYMLDISSGRMPTLPTLFRLVDLLAELKYNELQLTMQSVCFRYDRLEEFMDGVETLTGEDIEKLDAYCRERFIELVPHQNTFGHLGAWLYKPGLRHLSVHPEGGNGATLNILLPEALEFVDKLLGSLLPHFSSKRVNICLDEALGLGEHQLKEICEKKGRAEVFMDWLNTVADLCEKKYGKTVQFWSDMMIRYPETFHRIPKNATVMHWDYDLIGSSMFEGDCRTLKEHGQKFYICPGNAAWLSYTGRFDVMTFNVRTAGEIGRKYGADGYLMTDWGSGDGHIHFPVFALIPAALAAQYCWFDGEPQAEGSLKAHNIDNACRFIDERYFGGKKISSYIFRLGQYYQLESHRIHSSTQCSLIFRLPFDKKEVPGFFSVYDSPDGFYEKAVVSYLNAVIADIEAADFDGHFKREMLVDAKMAVFATEMMALRRTEKVTPEKKAELLALADWIEGEYSALWDMDNYPDGKQIYLKQLIHHRDVLLSGRLDQ